MKELIRTTLLFPITSRFARGRFHLKYNFPLNFTTDLSIESSLQLKYPAVFLPLTISSIGLCLYNEFLTTLHIIIPRSCCEKLPRCC